MMKTPVHWKDKNIIAAALLPLGCLYALVTWLRMRFGRPRKTCAPVICVGNLTAGGSGKTPVAISLARLLQQVGKKPFFVTRGYGGRLQHIMVDLARHTPQQVGDEPLLLAAAAPTVVDKERFEGAEMAIQNGADVIIMDDGFQNPSLYKDKSLLVIDGAAGMGNLWPVPAGPMREFLLQGIKRADAVIMLGEDKHNLLPKFNGLPVFKGDVVPVKPVCDKPHAIAFAGIGRPQKFYQSLEDCGITLVKTKDFSDHHFYSREELMQLINEAKELNAALFTTSKDMVKIPADLRPNFNVLKIAVKWQDEAAIKRFLLG